MAKLKKGFVCQECGYVSVKWMGRCPSCGSWNTIVEDIINKGSVIEASFEAVPLVRLKEEGELRIKTGMEVLDSALGGGLLKGQVTLIAGEPGIGKSTLLLQVADKFNGPVLYVSGEESGLQIASRAKRIGTLSSDIFLLTETNFENIESNIYSLNPSLIVIDSIQTIFTSELDSSAGSVSQVRECTFKLVKICKERGIPAFIVGQVTKEGLVAGPKVLEHIVDTVLYFEGERYNFYRVLKVVKNRFGTTGEIAMFKMTDRGMEEIKNPSQFLVSEERKKPGSVVFPYTEGSKPLLLEIQALVIPALYTTPQRKTQGYDINRLALILAVLEKEVKLFTRDLDVFVNVAGGIQVKEPAVDLPVLLAIVSSKKDISIPERVVVFGEVGLSGEVRPVHLGDVRVKEATKYGYKTVIAPKGAEIDIDGAEVITVSHVSEAVDIIAGMS